MLCFYDIIFDCFIDKDEKWMNGAYKSALWNKSIYRPYPPKITSVHLRMTYGQSYEQRPNI